MRGNELLDKMELIAPAYVEAADTKPERRKSTWVKWGAAAACLCLLIAGAVQLLAPGRGGTPVLEWAEGFPAESYFRYNLSIDDAASSKCIADSDVPYAASRDFSGFRSRMEDDGVIPPMPDHPLYTCTARYDEAGAILCVTFSWHRRGEAYSDLSITAGYQEMAQIRDCVYVELDSSGNIVPPSVTVTERDGVRIVAQGNELCEKALTFETGGTWYQIAGSWGDGYEAMAELLDWVWEHPVSFDLFTMDKGAEIRSVSLEECPGAFAGYLPDFGALGYVRGENYLLLKDGVPYRFEGHYYSGVEEARVEDGSYLFETGWTEIHWCIDTEPDIYDLQDCLGDISGLTEQRIAAALSEKSSFSFTLDDCFIRVYCKDAGEAWAAVESLTELPG